MTLDDNSTLRHVHSFQLDARWKPQDTYVAVFVQHPDSGDILQVLSAFCR